MTSKDFQNLLLAGFIIILCCNLVFMAKLSDRVESVLDYGKFVGKFESDVAANQRELVNLREEINTEQAWKSSLKSKLAMLSTMVASAEQKAILEQIASGG